MTSLVFFSFTNHSCPFPSPRAPWCQCWLDWSARSASEIMVELRTGRAWEGESVARAHRWLGGRALSHLGPIDVIGITYSPQHFWLPQSLQQLKFIFSMKKPGTQANSEQKVVPQKKNGLIFVSRITLVCPLHIDLL